MKQIIKVSGMHCEGCENRIKNILSSIENIKEVNASYTKGTVEINFDNNIDLKIVKEKIENLGFEVEDKNE